MVHPAPRMINAPVPKSRMYFRGTGAGALSAYEAIVIDQANNNNSDSWLHWTPPHMTRSSRGKTHCRDRIIKRFRWACQRE